MKETTLFFLILLLGAGSASAPEASSQGVLDRSRRPNIILILTDDQGYGDLGRHGNPILKTPNLDRLHDESVRLTDFHVSPTCAPTRSALMSGRHDFKNGVRWALYDVLTDPGETTDIAAAQPDIVKAMSAEYDKWWAEVLPCLVNENAVQPAVNPYHEQYWKQYKGPGPNNAPPGAKPAHK